jgi:hypothetical protein
VASDQARTMTAADVKISCGGIMELDAWICDLGASPLPLSTTGATSFADIRLLLGRQGRIGESLK